jgi:hypothetical protein
VRAARREPSFRIHRAQRRIDLPHGLAGRQGDRVVKLILGGEEKRQGSAGQQGGFLGNDAEACRWALGRRGEDDQGIGDPPLAAVGGPILDRAAHPEGRGAAAVQVDRLAAAQLAHQGR